MYHRNLCLVSIITKSMSGNSKKYVNIVTLTFNLEIQGQTWHNAFTIISLVAYIIETCVWCLQLLNHYQRIQKIYINIVNMLPWPWNPIIAKLLSVRGFKIYIYIVTLTFDLEIHSQTWRNAFNIYLYISVSSTYHLNLCLVSTISESMSENSKRYVIYGRQPSIPLINLGRRWTLSWWWGSMMSILWSWPEFQDQKSMSQHWHLYLLNSLLTSV